MGTLVDDPRLDGFSLLDHGDRDAVWKAVEVSRRNATGVMLAMINIVELSGSYVDDGHHDVVRWVDANLATSRAEAKALVHAARLIRDHPTVGDALADGHLAMPHVAQFVLLHQNDRVRPALAARPALIAELIEYASLHPFNEFQIICKRVERNADPDGTLNDHEAAFNERKISSTRRGTAHRIVADGDALSGAVFDDVLARFVQIEFERDWAEGRRLHGDQMNASRMPRSDRQRRFDAFIAMIRAADDHRDHRCSRTGRGAGRGRAAQPLVVIHTDPDTVADVIRNHGSTGPTGASYRPAPASPDDFIRTTNPGADPAAADEPETDTADSAAGAAANSPADIPAAEIAALVGRRAETSNGAPVSDNDLFLALLLGNVQRVIHDPADGHIIDLGRARRLFTGAARKAALAEHHTCSHPGCGITGLGVQLDHNTPWAALMGPTDQRNVRIKCRFHNLAKEKLGLRTERRPGRPGAYQTFRPDGTEIAPRTSPATFRRRKHPPDPTG